MSRPIRTLLALALALAAPARADVTFSVSHTGRILGADDKPLEAPTAALRFRILNRDVTSDGEVELWKAVCTVPVLSGFYTVTRGAGCGGALSSSLFPAAEGRWLEFSIESQVLSPRLRFGTAPTAAVAQDA